MELEQARTQLLKKADILDRIAKNTGMQHRLVRRHDMRGLKRLLIERGRMIDELAQVNTEFQGDDIWKNWSELKGIMSSILVKERAIMDLNDEVLQTAMEEKAKIAAELNNSRVMREVKNHYIKSWTLTQYRSSINLKT